MEYRVFCAVPRDGIYLLYQFAESIKIVCVLHLDVAQIVRDASVESTTNDTMSVLCLVLVNSSVQLDVEVRLIERIRKWRVGQFVNIVCIGHTEHEL